MFLLIILILALSASSQLGEEPWIELETGVTGYFSLDITTTLLQYRIQQQKTPYNLTFIVATSLYLPSGVGQFAMLYKMSGSVTDTSSLVIGAAGGSGCEDYTVLQYNLPEQISWDLLSANVATVNGSITADFSSCSDYEGWRSVVESGNIAKARMVLDDVTNNLAQYLTVYYRVISRTGPNIAAIVGAAIAGGVLLIIVIVCSAYLHVILKRRDYNYIRNQEESSEEETFERTFSEEETFKRNLPTLAHGQTHVFLSHDWGNELEQNNHERVSFVNDELKKRGCKTWFDEDKMTGNIVDKMCEGIDNTRVVLVFVTRRYCEKVGGAYANDNCKLEFNYAQRKKTGTHMLPIVMEERMKNPSKWTGALGMALGGTLYVDFTGDNQQMLNSFAMLESEIARRISIN